MAEVAGDGRLGHEEGLFGRGPRLVTDRNLRLLARGALVRLGQRLGGAEADEPGEHANAEALDRMAPVSRRRQRASDTVEAVVFHRFSSSLMKP
jgi:hypothetical protein